MTSVFQQRIASHNRYAVTASLLSLLGASLAWAISYALFAGLTLGAITVVHGAEIITGEMHAGIPGWLHPAALIFALVTLVWAAVNERRYRYRPTPDRPVVGWHLLGDILLLPARLTWGVGQHLTGVIRLSPSERAEALDLLKHIHTEKRCPAHSLGAWFPDQKRLRKLLLGLQLAGWIDLLPTEHGPIYIERSSEAEEIAEIFEDLTGVPPDL